MADSTQATTTGKPARKAGKAPQRSPKVAAMLRKLGLAADFPLTPHPSGRWCKKFNQTTYYYGALEDPAAALAEYLRVKDFDMGGEARPAADDARGLFRVRNLVNDFLNAQREKVERGELTERAFHDYVRTGKMMALELGADRTAGKLTPADFRKFADAMREWSPVTRANQIQRVRTFFKWAYESQLLERPMIFGPDFKKPSAGNLRKARAAREKRFFDADEIRALLKGASVQMKAMILLGVNCGLGNSDISALNREHLDLERGILDFPRPKNGVERRATLWPETVEAVRDVLTWGAEKIKQRQGPALPRYRVEDPADAGAVFLTKKHQRFVRHGLKHSRDGIAGVFKTLCQMATVERNGKKTPIKDEGEREGVNFYALRHTFETIAGRARDQVAVDRIMGHADASIADRYREWHKDAEEDARLRAVTDYVRYWLWPEKKPAAAPAA